MIDDLLQELQPSVVLEASCSVDSSCVDQPFQEQGTQSNSTISHAHTRVNTFDAADAAADICAVPDAESIDDHSVSDIIDLFLFLYRTLSDDYVDVRARVGRLHLHEYIRSSHLVIPATVP